MDRKFLDVNAIAVFLDSDHVGHPYVRDAVAPGLRGAFEVLLNAYQLVRARWIMVNRWGLNPIDADEAVGSIAALPSVTYVEGDGEVVLEALRLSREIRHDVYDCFVAKLAARADATHFVTTDAGIREACKATGIEYENPVPPAILRRFGVSGR